MFRGVGVGAEYPGYTISSRENVLDHLLSFPPHPRVTYYARISRRGAGTYGVFGQVEMIRDAGGQLERRVRAQAPIASFC